MPKPVLTAVSLSPRGHIAMFGSSIAKKIGADLQGEGEAIKVEMPEGQEAIIRFGDDGTILIVSKTPITVTVPHNRPGIADIGIRLALSPGKALRKILSPAGRETQTIGPEDVGDAADLLGL